MIIGYSAFTTTLQQKYIEWHGLTFSTSDILTFATFLVLAYTAIQALRTRQATARAAILTTLPILFVDLTKHNDIFHLQLRNHGNGTAFKIRFEDSYTDYLDVNDRWKLQFNIRPGHLLANESRLLGSKVTDMRGNDINDSEMMTFMFVRRDKAVPFRIFFEDVSGKKYMTVVRTGKGLVEIDRPSIPYTWFRYLEVEIYGWFKLRLSFLKNRIRRRYEMKHHPTFATRYLNPGKKKK